MDPADPDELARAAREIADGVEAAPSRSGALHESERRALELLQALRWRASAGDPARSGDAASSATPLGSGANARVHKASDPLLQRPVAVKVLPLDRFDSAAQRARFLDEARKLASVEHPNVVRIHRVEERADAVALELELVEGRTLEAWVREDGPLGADEAARVGIDLCRALAAIHARGLVHCDLKPANVMRERGGRIVVLDFGVARARGAAARARASAPESGATRAGPPELGATRSGAPESGATRSGAPERGAARASALEPAGGTPLFMSPEQFRGERDLGPQTDLHALGCLLYWLVSGALPFEATTFAELSRRVLAGEHVPLLDRRADVPAGFAAIVERALAVEPARRFATAGELERALRELAVSVAPDARAAQRTRPRPPAAALVAAVVLALGIVAVLVWIGAQRATEDRPAAAWDCRLRVVRGERELELASGASVRVGDRLRLELSPSDESHVYVFDEDERGAFFVLFPLPGFEPRNPLAGGATHVLPGTSGGVERAWVVTSAGGTETLLVVRSREPLAELEELCAQLPAASEGREPQAAHELDHVASARVLRGIGGTAALARTPSLERSGARRLDALADELRVHPRAGVDVRRLHVVAAP